MGLYSEAGNFHPDAAERGVVFLGCHNAIWELAGSLIAGGINPDGATHEELAADLTNTLCSRRDRHAGNEATNRCAAAWRLRLLVRLTRMPPAAQSLRREASVRSISIRRAHFIVKSVPIPCSCSSSCLSRCRDSLACAPTCSDRRFVYAFELELDLKRINHTQPSAASTNRKSVLLNGRAIVGVPEEAHVE